MSRRPGFFRVLWRGIRRRCPRCGAGELFESWFKMRPSCPSCGLETERREEGFWLGGMAINLGITQLLFFAFLIGGMVLTWPDPPWTWLLVGGVALNVVLPFLFYPMSKSVFLAIDMLMFRMDPGQDQPSGPYDSPSEPRGSE